MLNCDLTSTNLTLLDPFDTRHFQESQYTDVYHVSLRSSKTDRTQLLVDNGNKSIHTTNGGVVPLCDNNKETDNITSSYSIEIEEDSDDKGQLLQTIDDDKGHLPLDPKQDTADSAAHQGNWQK